VLSAVVGRSSGWLSQRENVSLLLPSVVFGAAVAALSARAAGWSAAKTWLKGLDGPQTALLTLGVAIALVVFVQLLQHLLRPLTRLYAGYWGAGRWSSKLADRARERQGNKRRRLRDVIDATTDESARDAAYATYFACFPPVPERVMPTRLGNVLRAAEAYPNDERRYRMDAAFFWPRLYPLLPEPLRAELGASRSTIDLTLVSATLAGLLAALVLAFGGVAQLGWPLRLLLVVLLVLAAYLLYRWSVVAAVLYGELVRSAFDVSRRTLLVSLGVCLPGTLEEEQRIWQALAQWLYRGGVSEELEGALRFKADPP